MAADVAATPDRVVIIGASLGGQTAAVELRKNGYAGEIVLISDENALPYDRPPLSKKVLIGDSTAADIELKSAEFYQEQNIELRLATRVIKVNSAEKTVTTAGGEVLGYSSLIIATGGRSRKLDIPGRDLEGIHQILAIKDAQRILTELPGVKNVVVVGGGFIGAESAAALRARGLNVSMIEVSPALMSAAIGVEVGTVIAGYFREEGVDLNFNTTVDSYLGENGRVNAVQSADGRVFPADLVIEAIGIIPNVELAEAAGCRLDNGVIVDEYMRTRVDDVYAIGDIARYPSRYARGPRDDVAKDRIRVEHWAVAIGHGTTAAKSICEIDEAYDDLPWFWSDQFGTTYNYAGHAPDWDELVWRGDTAERKFAVFYMLKGRLAGALCAGPPKEFRAAKLLLSKGANVDRDVLRDVDVDLYKYAKSV